MFRSFVFVAAALLALVPTTSCAFVDKVVEKSLDASTSTGNGNLRNTLGRETGNRQLQLLELEGFGGSPDAKHLPFNECQGDCDDDSGE